MQQLERLTLTLGGVVQGVGFRPFVHRLAHELGLGGWVQNRSGRVFIVLEGEPGRLQAFRQRICREAPPLAAPDIQEEYSEPIKIARSGFAIHESHSDNSADIHLPPDTHMCADCRRELFDPGNRRYRYPFINCTQCGPRYTLITALPYDRERTSMAGFAMCPVCHAEYTNPSDRRFHAEPIACPTCGPQLRWKDLSGEQALAAALAALQRGAIVAVRGVGGYHLMCDARNEQAVTTLRHRKQRPTRPFAVLFDETGPDGAQALWAHLQPTPTELTLLRSPQRPIVLVGTQAEHTLAASVAPGMRRIGAMLPHSPLQALLVGDFGGPLIATSGNLSGEPIALAPEEAERRLGHIADGFLHHDRPILRPAEDGVWQVHRQTPLPIRLGRGEAPQEWHLAKPLPSPTLALGGEQKVCVALGWGNRAVVSPHIGDLSHPESMTWLTHVAKNLCELYQITPACIAIDAHPGYQSRQWALTQNLPVKEVWHHPAHASALCAEHPAIEDWVMLCWDGVGLGPDHTLWGGEILRGAPGRWQRIASLRPFRLPGGEAASRECWRSAAGMLWEAGLPVPQWHPQMELLHAAWQKQINSPVSSAVGRLFDGAAALLDVCTLASFEGEGPMRLQSLAETVDTAPSWPIDWQRHGELWQLDWAPWLACLLDPGITVAERARALHRALAQAVARLLHQLDVPTSTALGGTGGVFQNTLLISMLEEAGLPIQVAKRQPANDGGLALGQLLEIAALTPLSA
jgi:hydrogenase maturation protein HypF